MEASSSCKPRRCGKTSPLATDMRIRVPVAGHGGEPGGDDLKQVGGADAGVLAIDIDAEATAVGGIFGYSHTAGGYHGGQAEFVRVPKANVGPITGRSRSDRRLTDLAEQLKAAV